MNDDKRIKQLRAMDRKIGGCGCGQPYRHWAAIKGTLEAIKHKTDSGNIVDQIKDRVSHEDLAYFALSMMDHFELTTHGGSIYGSWLEPAGEKSLELLTEFGTGEDTDWPDGHMYYTMTEPTDIDDIVWATDFEGKSPPIKPITNPPRVL